MKCVICKKQGANNCMDTQVQEDGSCSGIAFHNWCLEKECKEEEEVQTFIDGGITMVEVKQDE